MVKPTGGRSGRGSSWRMVVERSRRPGRLCIVLYVTAKGAVGTTLPENREEDGERIG